MGKILGEEVAANTPERGSYSGVLNVQVKLCCLLNNQISEYSSCHKSASRRRWRWPIARDNSGSLGQASATASGLDLPAGSYSNILYDYGTQNAAISYTEVAATTEVSVLIDYLGLVSLSDSGGSPISITSSDSYWQGKILLSRNGATILAAARDELGRLRVLDGTGTDVYAWILDENGFYQGEEGPSDTSLQVKEVLFQIDIDGDGIIG